MFKKATLLIICFVISNSTFFAQGKQIIVDQTQYQYPVLKMKEFNHILRLNIKKTDTLSKTVLKAIVINTKGTTNLKDIENISLYYHPSGAELLNDRKILFACTTKIDAQVKLEGSMELTSDNNYFWISYKLKDDANLLNQIGGFCEKIITNNGNVKAKPLLDVKKLRIGVALREHGEENVDTYRIPALVTTNKGTLIAAFEARRNSARDLQGDNDIAISRSTDGGETWGPTQIILDMGEWGGLPEKFNGFSDASLLVDEVNGTIFAPGIWMHGVIDKNGTWIENLTEESKDWNHQWKNKGSQPGFGVKETTQYMMAKSTDDGKTWSDPINLTKMLKKKEWWLFSATPGNGITLKDGTLVLPAQGRDKNGVPFSCIIYSKDRGTTWKTSNPAYNNTTECSVVQLEDGSLMLNMRDNRNRKKTRTNGRAIAVTYDLGESWIMHSTSHSALIEPVCMASLYKHHYTLNGVQKSVLLFSNPNTKEGRYDLTIKASFDNGKTWPKKYWLLLDEGYGRGYSSLTSIDENNIGILYEGSQADMTFQKISFSSFLEKAIKNKTTNKNN
ncbi:sialidase family protein [uncultured Polaribacter sp.]|uniref:sialidase family protein n=1 Tax=uncultured Polaribacter sp. TaxID=174711 RepID=UPI00261F5607|nr:sialidase family protein [uncultured Polaribacter sp.]